MVVCGKDKARKAEEKDVIKIEHTHDAIISETLWEKAHAAVKENKENLWFKQLVSLGKLEALDRLTVSQTVKEIIGHE